ncbi:SAM hydrolase/SAM-dependent halogenase family protein [Halegenticoccus tardaugens]|uniref:SAM hydrolase/SAM-dependent halogenase family protein n=1 Tax=Halegenticoccus tardaugens TaxID=2071624 RepID=UPI00100BFB4F|nr:SAM-dependent chlorinase/fluorinase [Halegenticoccus tardaugens]
MITLASDFGSPYPAAMRGVLLRRTDARLVDVAHDFPRQDVRAAAFWLREVLPWFPPAVHLAVVDPGVGTDRAALVVRAGEHALVGPDNGLLLPAARRIAAESPASPSPSADETGDDADGGDDPDDAVEVFAYAYDNPDSATFHGRDVFAPAAAEVHEAGVGALETLSAATPAAEFVDLAFPEPTVREDDATGRALAVDGEVLVVDDFGNAITNVPGEVVRGRDAVVVNGERVPVGESFASVDAGERLVTVGSHGSVECDVNRGRGDEAFGLAPGDAVDIELGR